MAMQLKFRSGTAAAWTAANPTLAQGELGVEYDTGKFKYGSGTTAWNSLAYSGQTGPAQTKPYRSMGDGSDGNVTISSGTTTLVRDMFYNNLTMSGTGVLKTNGYRVFVKGNLDITAAQVGAINCNGGNGGNASTSTGGTAGSAQSQTGSLGFGGNAGAGANGGTGVGPAGNAGDGNISPQNGGTNGASGVGGAGVSAGGAAGTAIGQQVECRISRWETNMLYGLAVINGGTAGRGAAAGGGDGTVSGGGGGGGGAGGAVMALYINAIIKSSATPAGVIQANGGNGGNGGNVTGNAGGGGGGAGGGGGWVYLAYNSLYGPSISNLIQANGGNGGSGGNGSGTGNGGNGGGAGQSGCITVLCIPEQTGSSLYGTVNTTLIPDPLGDVSPAINASGGSGGSSVPLQVSL